MPEWGPHAAGRPPTPPTPRSLLVPQPQEQVMGGPVARRGGMCVVYMLLGKRSGVGFFHAGYREADPPASTARGSPWGTGCLWAQR